MCSRVACTTAIEASWQGCSCCCRSCCWCCTAASFEAAGAVLTWCYSNCNGRPRCHRSAGGPWPEQSRCERVFKPSRTRVVDGQNRGDCARIMRAHIGAILGQLKLYCPLREAHKTQPKHAGVSCWLTHGVRLSTPLTSFMWRFCDLQSFMRCAPYVCLCYYYCLGVCEFL